MGSDAHVVVVGGPKDVIERARTRIDQLEGRWSRFLPESEISQLNDRAGTPLAVSDDTVELITRAVEAWRFTGATFDPTAGFSSGSIGSSTAGAGFLRSGRWCHPPHWPSS